MKLLQLYCLLSVALEHSNAFVVWSHTPKNHQDIASVKESSRDFLPEDVESAREAFEELFRDESVSSVVFPKKNNDHFDADDQDQEILTSVGRRRCELEMALLDSLRNSDDAIDELMHLWITERDDESANRIFRMQEECSSGLVEEERMLRAMMERYPTWAEPFIRLATVLYYKGRTEESRELALYTLHIKPWHIEAPQLLTLLALRDQDVGKALYWARRGLPPLRGDLMSSDDMSEKAGPVFSQRRHLWVDRMIKLAEEQLHQAERTRDEYEHEQHLAWPHSSKYEKGDETALQFQAWQ